MQAWPDVFDAPHKVDDLPHFGDAQRRGRLIEDDEVGVEVHGAADGDALAFAARKIADRRIDRDADAAKADDVDEDLVGDLLLALDVDEAEAVGDLPADEEVAPQRLFVGERLVLVDRLDGKIVRPAHRIVGEVDRLIAYEDAAGGRRNHAGHDLDDRRLAGAVVADQADDFVLADAQVDVAERLHGAEILLHAFEPDDRLECRRFRARRCSGHDIGPARFTLFDPPYRPINFAGA